MKETIDILQFFGVNKPLFVMSGLACDNTKRFVGREELLKYFIITIQMRQNCALGKNLLPLETPGHDERFHIQRLPPVLFPRR
jgi:hypothetical protein